MKRSIALSLIIVAMNLIAIAQSGSRSVTVGRDALAAVPSDKRARLLQRLELYFHAIFSRDFGQIYQFRPTGCTGGLTKDKWIKQARETSPGRLQLFVVDEVYTGDFTAAANQPGEKWIARGCGTYVRRGKLTKYQSSVGLVFTNNDWFVCDNGVVVEGPKDEPVLCSGGI